MKTEIEEIKEEFEILWHRLLFLERNILVEKRKIFADIEKMKFKCDEITDSKVIGHYEVVLLNDIEYIKKKYLGDEK